MSVRDTWAPEFLRRLAHREDEMKWLYMELYNNQEAYDYFVGMLYRVYSERDEKLKLWDQYRHEQASGWYRSNDMLGMVMYVNCFAENLRGVMDHFDYLKQCGIKYLHLMPPLASPKGKSDGGYAVSDFRKIEPELGTMEDLRKLAAMCHKARIYVCLDFVMNHTSDEHEWAIKAKEGQKEYMDRYFFFDDWSVPNEFEKTVPQVFPTTAPGNFSWCPEVNKVVMTTFYPYQWDLNYGNCVVFNDMTENMLYLCNHGVDILRLDAVPYIWKELGTNCRNLPKVHTLVRIMRLASEIVCPGTLLLGEVVMEPSKVVPYFGTVEKPECHLLYNVTTMASMWHTVATKDVNLLKHQLASVFALPGEYTFLNYLRCHDDIGWGLDYDFLAGYGMEQVAHKKFLNDYLTGKYYGSYARGELYNDDPKLGDARLCGTTASLCGIEGALEKNDAEKLRDAIRFDRMLHAFLLTQSGIPVIYSGDEVGQLNDNSYHDDPLKREDSRYIHRGNFVWEKTAHLEDPKTVEGEIYQSIMKLAKIRKQYTVFNSKADVWLLEPYNDHILGIGRYYEGQKLLALFNFAEDEEIAWIYEDETYTDLWTMKPRSAHEVRVPGHDFVWLFREYEGGYSDETDLSGY